MTTATCWGVPYVNPGYYSWAYPSSMVSKYYCWFVLMGHKELDINVYDDGSWDIIQYYNSPIIPSLTKWQTVLGNMKNIEISLGFCEKWIKQCDMHRKEFWRREEEKTRQVEEEHKKLQEHKMDSVRRAHQAITKNEGLMNRIAKNGLQEMDLSRIARHIPKSEL